MLRHNIFVAAVLDAGVDLRDVKVAASHADPRTTMICPVQRRSCRTLWKAFNARDAGRFADC
jgi:site-specific recombinase XerD